MLDPISDMLNRIRNAQAAKKETVDVPFSKLLYELGKVLEKKGFLKNVDFRGKKPKKLIEIRLRYTDKIPAVSGAKRVSKPGQRMYVSAREIRRIKGGYGITVLSTSKGLMAGQDAKTEHIGGEVLCEVW
mgnify:CR=1 FL=1